jgi:hypothetical protein
MEAHSFDCQYLARTTAKNYLIDIPFPRYDISQQHGRQRRDYLMSEIQLCLGDIREHDRFCNLFRTIEGFIHICFDPC